jgi:hypothetical protein
MKKKSIWMSLKKVNRLRAEIDLPLLKKLKSPANEVADSSRR